MSDKLNAIGFTRTLSTWLVLAALVCAWIATSFWILQTASANPVTRSEPAVDNEVGDQRKHIAKRSDVWKKDGDSDFNRDALDEARTLAEKNVVDALNLQNLQQPTSEQEAAEVAGSVAVDEQKAAEEAQQFAEQEAAEEAQRLAEQETAAEVQRLAEREAAAEAQRIAEQEAAEEAQRLAELEAAEAAQRIAEQEAAEEGQRLAEQEAAAEAQRLAEQEAAAEAQRIAEQEAAAEAQRLAEREAAAEAQRIAEQEAAAEAQRIAEQEAAAEAQRIAEQEAAEEAQRLAEREAAAEAQRLAEQEAAAEAQRIAEQEAAEEAQRLAEQQSVEVELPVTVDLLTPDVMEPASNLKDDNETVDLLTPDVMEPSSSLSDDKNHSGKEHLRRVATGDWYRQQQQRLSDEQRALKAARERTRYAGFLNVLSGFLRFENRNEVIGPEIEQVLERMLDPLQRYPSSLATVTVASNEFKGLADNNRLSQARGRALVSYFTRHGLQSDRFTINIERDEGLQYGSHRVRVSIKELER